MEGLKIKEFLEREGEKLGIRKQEELADVLGVSDQTVSNWANAITFPPHKTEYRLLEMGMTVEELTDLIAKVEKQMRAAAAELNFEMAAELRDRMKELKENLNDASDGGIIRVRTASAVPAPAYRLLISLI